MGKKYFDVTTKVDTYVVGRGWLKTVGVRVSRSHLSTGLGWSVPGLWVGAVPLVGVETPPTGHSSSTDWSTSSCAHLPFFFSFILSLLGTTTHFLTGWVDVKGIYKSTCRTLLEGTKIPVLRHSYFILAPIEYKEKNGQQNRKMK